MFAHGRWLGLLFGFALVRPALAVDRPVVYLDAGIGWCIGAGDAPCYGLLTRELARQAFLIAAREECGACTRDAWLGDSLPETGDNPPFDLLGSPGQPTLLEIARGFVPKQRSIWQQDLPIGTRLDYAKFVAQMEGMSRDQFVRVLVSQGFHRATPRPQNPNRGTLSTEVANRLDEMTFTSQFAAVRQLHEQQDADGDSPARLAGLVRGYANLGLLSEYFWNPMHQVFKARALLYAERLVVHENKSSWTLAHRAYARALVGLHGAALEDLEATQDNAAANQQALPKWADLLADFCMFNATALKNASEPSEQQLAAVLRLAMAEQSNVPGMTPRTARAESVVVPECYRICDGYLLSPAYNHPDEREEQPPNGSVVLAKTLYDRLQELPGLPESVRAATESHASNELARREAVILALLAIEAKEAAKLHDEFGWALLGRMICEVSFYQAWREIRPDTGGTADETVIKLRPAYSQHPYAGFLEMGQQESIKYRKGHLKFLHDASGEAFEFTSWPLVRSMERESFNFQGNSFFETIERRMDDVARNLAWRVQNEPNASSVERAQVLLNVSPFHPIARTALIKFAWDKVRGQASDWERTSRSQPTVLLALSEQYAVHQDSTSAERLLQSISELTPTAEFISALAEQYAHAGNYEAWLRTMERLADLPDVRDRGGTHAAIVEECMNRADWPKAHEHADAGIKAGSTAGLLGGARFYEAQELWDLAEACYRKASEGDPAAAFEWYFFCKRTGQGDANRAAAIVAKYMGGREAQKYSDPRAQLYMQILPGTYFLLAKKPETARQYFDEEFVRNGDPYCGLEVALISDHLKDLKLRDQRLADISARHARWKQLTPRTPHDELVAVAAMLAADLRKKGDGDFDLTSIDKLLSAANEIERINCNYFIGEYLQVHGKPEKAIHWWMKCMALLPVGAASRTLAGSELFDDRISPAEYEKSVKDRTAKPVVGGPSEK